MKWSVRVLTSAPTYNMQYPCQPTNCPGNDNCVTLKLDIIKAYDMIAWEYMQEQMSKWVLERGGFSE